MLIFKDPKLVFCCKINALASHGHFREGNPIGEGKRDALRVHFDRRLRLEFRGGRITSDAGLPAWKLSDVVETEGSVCADP